MSRKTKTLRSDMGWSDTTTITVKGRNLMTDIMGKLNLGDFAFPGAKSRANGADRSGSDIQAGADPPTTGEQ